MSCQTTHPLEFIVGTLSSITAAAIVAAFLWTKTSLDCARTGEDQLETFRERVVVGV
ncbi:MAG: hypothetical protein JWO91_1184 [Acidobacteriaceae bacterium]|nr:hypothetical protein [Acidobacteriaceae bacterium]